MVDDENLDDSQQTRESPLCTLCDMIVFWVQVQLKQRNTRERILNYIDEVINYSIATFFEIKYYLIN